METITWTTAKIFNDEWGIRRLSSTSFHILTFENTISLPRWRSTCASKPYGLPFCTYWFSSKKQKLLLYKETQSNCLKWFNLLPSFFNYIVMYKQNFERKKKKVECVKTFFACNIKANASTLRSTQGIGMREEGLIYRTPSSDKALMSPQQIKPNQRRGRKVKKEEEERSVCEVHSQCRKLTVPPPKQKDRFFGCL